ncbi:MAG TPA: hypothetical protein VM369_09580 [Candidatus Binatia bacterium]|nr:hypothetical protein [Candidatus Binatia bacterium]
MKKNEVPQDRNPETGDERRALYAVDETGRYTTVPSAGWRADEIVNRQAVDEYARLAQDALARARRGEASPLEFHMYDRRMEVETLAQVAGLWRWRVRRHLRPDVFPRLDDALLARYADALGVPAAALRTVPPA